MARKPNEEYRKAKKNSILDNAFLVFSHKGYLNVTMQDIVDECNISRGGIYLYFNSLDEIFHAVVSNYIKSKYSTIRKSVDNNEPFASVIDSFLELQKSRLLHTENTLLRAMYEYNFSKSSSATPAFRNEQLSNLRKSVLSIFMLGLNQNILTHKNIFELADHFIVVIEGLSVMALVDVLTEKFVDDQFAMLHALTNENSLQI